MSVWNYIFRGRHSMRGPHHRVEGVVTISNIGLVSVSFDVNTSGNHTIVANPGGGQRIYVRAGRVIVAGDVDIQWRSGPNPLTGVESLAQDGNGYQMNFPAALDEYHFRTGVNHALTLNLSANEQVGGYICYIIAP